MTKGPMIKINDLFKENHKGTLCKRPKLEIAFLYILLWSFPFTNRAKPA